MNWADLYHGLCPLCSNGSRLRQSTEDVISCESNCGFKISTEKFYKRCKYKSQGYYVVKHNSLSDDEKMSEICQLQ